jgi:hypothetical protein
VSPFVFAHTQQRGFEKPMRAIDFIAQHSDCYADMKAAYDGADDCEVLSGHALEFGLRLFDFVRGLNEAA